MAEHLRPQRPPSLSPIPWPAIAARAATFTATFVAFAGSLLLGPVLANVAMARPCWLADYCIEAEHSLALANSFIALAAFYLWLVQALAVAFLVGVSPPLRRALLRPVRLCGWLFGGCTLTSLRVGVAAGLAWFAALVAFDLWFFAARTAELLESPAYAARNLAPARRAAFFASQVTGKLADVTTGLVLLLVAKHSAFFVLLGIPYDRLVRFHRWVSYFLVLVLALHSGLYVAYTAQYRSVTDLLSVLFYGSRRSETHDHDPGWGHGNWMVTLGTYSLILIVILTIFSIDVVRRRAFALFYAAHLLLSPPALVLAWLHAPSTLYYCIPGLIIYAADLILRAVAWTKRPYRVLDFVLEPTGHVRLDFERPLEWALHATLLTRAAGGSWVMVCVPSVSSGPAWHPYTLAHSPLDESDGRASIFFKPRRAGGGFEARLLAALVGGGDDDGSAETAVAEGRRKLLAAATSAATSAGVGGSSSWKYESLLPVGIRVDGPFGAPTFPVETQDVVVCLVAGTGASGGFGVAQRHAFARAEQAAGGRSPSTFLAWSLREDGGRGVSLVKRALSSGIRCCVYQTGGAAVVGGDEWSGNADEEDDVGHELTAVSAQGATNEEEARLLSVTYGQRLDAFAFLEEHLAAHVPDWRDRRKASVGVYICGSMAFNSAMRRGVCRFADRNTSAFVVSMHEEGYEL